MRSDFKHFEIIDDNEPYNIKFVWVWYFDYLFEIKKKETSKIKPYFINW